MVIDFINTPRISANYNGRLALSKVKQKNKNSFEQYDKKYNKIPHTIKKKLMCVKEVFSPPNYKILFLQTSAFFFPEVGLCFF